MPHAVCRQAKACCATRSFPTVSFPHVLLDGSTRQCCDRQPFPSGHVVPQQEGARTGTSGGAAGRGLLRGLPTACSGRMSSRAFFVWVPESIYCEAFFVGRKFTKADQPRAASWAMACGCVASSGHRDAAAAALMYPCFPCGPAQDRVPLAWVMPIFPKNALVVPSWELLGHYRETGATGQVQI